MYAELQQRMEEAVADFRAQQEKLREFHAETTARKTVVTSKNRMVSATVDSRGKLLELAIKGNRYRTLAPAELASLIVETVAKAQDSAVKESLAKAVELIPGAKDLGISDAGLDLDKVLDSTARLFDQPIFAEDLAGPLDRTVQRDG